MKTMVPDDGSGGSQLCTSKKDEMRDCHKYVEEFQTLTLLHFDFTLTSDQ